jgi:hypothetical protein
MKTHFFVTSLGGKDVILGMSWLKKENPHIDWTMEEVHLRECKISVEDAEEEDVFYDAQESLSKNGTLHRKPFPLLPLTISLTF